MGVRWNVVIFHKGKRKSYDTDDPKRAVKMVKALNYKGVKAHLVSYNKPTWPAEDDNMFLASEGMVWCPYCRKWRWYSIPNYKPNAEYMSEDWWLNVFNTGQIRICQWCHTSQQDWWVRKMNDMWDAVQGRRKRRNKTRRRRRS